MKICVADDEREVRISIIQKLHKLYQKEQIFDVGFGYMALEQISLIQPDILFLDIRMPELDGITLLQKIKKQHPGICVVIISGYDDFEYAQASIQHGAMNYLLKPIDPAHLKASVEEVREQLNKRFFTEFELMLSRHPNEYLSIEQVDVMDASLWFDERSSKSVLFESEMNETEEYSFMCAIELPMNTRVYIYKVSTEEANRYEMRGECIPFIVSHIEQREKAIFYGATAQNSSLTKQQHIAKEADKIRKEIIALALEQQIEKLELTLNEWYEQLIQLDLSVLRRECAYLMAAIDGAMTHPQLIIIEEDRYGYWLQWVKEHEQWIDLKASISAIVIGGMKALSQLQSELKENDTEKNWMDHVMSVIEQTPLAELNLEHVAEAVRVHPVTLSRLFKQHQGMNFVKYIGLKKLQLSQRLLLESGKRIQDIAEEVGYNDYRYFRSLFKKEFGISPSEYRRQNGINE